MGALNPRILRASSPRVLAALLLLFTLAAYFPAMHAGYIWDDGTLLTANPQMRSPAGLAEIWLGKSVRDYTPLTLTCFWLEWRLWDGDPDGYPRNHKTTVGRSLKRTIQAHKAERDKQGEEGFIVDVVTDQEEERMERECHREKHHSQRGTHVGQHPCQQQGGANVESHVRNLDRPQRVSEKKPAQ